jgi:imidazoleglycerol-phosphate dehydratase
MRKAEIKRNTSETKISLTLNLDGSGKAEIRSGCGFLDHMLTLFSRHALADLSLQCEGDTQVDYHHSTEDIAICLGRAVKAALGEARGIKRYGSAILPMDETLILCALDISGRGGFYPELNIAAQKVGDFDTELVEELFLAFTREASITLHLRQLAGSNSHHIIEGTFKAFARSLAKATALDENHADRIPSTKGVLG